VNERGEAWQSKTGTVCAHHVSEDHEGVSRRGFLAGTSGAALAAAATGLLGGRASAQASSSLPAPQVTDEGPIPANKEKIVEKGVWVVKESGALRYLKIAEGASLAAPAGKSLTMTVNGIGTAAQPGSYRGDIFLTVLEKLTLPGTGLMTGSTPRVYRTGIFVKDGRYLAEKSIPAIVQGGKVTDNAAIGVSISCPIPSNSILAFSWRFPKSVPQRRCSGWQFRGNPKKEMKVRKASSILTTSFALAIFIASSAMGQSANSASAGGTAPKHIKSVTAIGEIFGDGERYTAVAIEYDKDIDRSKLSPSAFSVASRTIKKVYLNSAPAKTSQSVNGRYVIIELSPDDTTAAIYSGGPGSGGGPGGPGGQSGPGGSGAQPGQVSPSGQGGPDAAGGPGPQAGPGAQGGGLGASSNGQANGARTAMGMGGATQKPAKLSVVQVGEVTTTTGEKYAGGQAAFENDKAFHLIADDFKQFEFKDPETGMSLPYNLYIPRSYDNTKSYPLVLFMHDASVTGAETTRTLTQGLGAIIWATPSEQAKHEAFVLAPAFGAGFGTEGAAGDTTADTVVHLLNSVTSQYSVDKNRMYATGQSFGCMMSLAIMIKYPDLFAASMLVAGQRDAQLTSVLAHNQMWIIVSEGDTRAFPGMNASVEVWEKEGAKISKATWNARLSDADLTAEARKIVAEGNKIKYTTFLKGTTLPVGHAPDNEHMQTWKVAYSITGVRDWLFSQKKVTGQ
jgi:predicted peptidase